MKPSREVESALREMYERGHPAWQQENRHVWDAANMIADMQEALKAIQSLARDADGLGTAETMALILDWTSVAEECELRGMDGLAELAGGDAEGEPEERAR